MHVEEGEELGVDRGESVETGKRRPGEAALEGRKKSTSLGGNELPSDEQTVTQVAANQAQVSSRSQRSWKEWNWQAAWVQGTVKRSVAEEEKEEKSGILSPP